RLPSPEADADRRDARREPAEVVVAGAIFAALRADRLERAATLGHAPADRRNWRVEDDDRFVAVGRRGDARLHERRRVLRGQRARFEAYARRRRPREPVDAERAPVLAPAVPRDEVPAAPVVEQRMRLD